MKSVKRSKDELTIKQLAFVEEITRTDKDRPASQTEAYIRAYNPTSESRKSLQNLASRAFRNPKIQAAIKRKQAKLELERQKNRRTSLALVENMLFVEAKEAKDSRDRINALKALAGILKPAKGEREEQDDFSTLTKDELETEVRELLESVVGTPVDVTPGKIALVNDDEPSGLDVHTCDEEDDSDSEKETGDKHTKERKHSIFLPVVVSDGVVIEKESEEIATDSDSIDGESFPEY